MKYIYLSKFASLDIDMVAHGTYCWHQGDGHHHDDHQGGDVRVRVPLVGGEVGRVGGRLA